jgi:hypothetical protein
MTNWQSWLVLVDRFVSSVTMYIFAARIVILADTIIFEIKEPRNVTNKLVRGIVKQRREHVYRVVCVNMYLKTVAKGERKHCPTVICDVSKGIVRVCVLLPLGLDWSPPFRAIGCYVRARKRVRRRLSRIPGPCTRNLLSGWFTFSLFLSHVSADVCAPCAVSAWCVRFRLPIVESSILQRSVRYRGFSVP